ncbi:secretogranin-2-like [Xyrauchen texanus]|uniref:secretogranin-2-like n=1 Tax=Xyrauchen texanus TaxID=154827 RepID=UPI00224290F8|nr:secretogranin-2-like [Xyrauchen texanus]
MSSPSRCCATYVSILPSLLLLSFFPSFIFGVQGATLRDHRLSGSEPGSYGPVSQLHPPPSAEMLRALRYIQNLSQRTSSDLLADDQEPTTADYDSDDMESIRSMLQLASPARSATGMDRGIEEREEDKDRDNTQEWLQAVLTTLHKTEGQTEPQKLSQKFITHASLPSRPHYAIQPHLRPKQQLKPETSAENYGRSSWANSGSRRPHRQFPLMFEDEDGQEQPLKRTNENAEEQYTPQKLATLQSVFEELSGISASKAASKANSKMESAGANTAADDEEDEDDDDLYRQRKMALEGIMGPDEWAPLEEQIENKGESERHSFTRNLEDDEQEQEEEEEEDDDVKRSNQSDLFQTEKEDPEDIAKLVDYYLRKVLEKKKQEEQANKWEQEEDESDREVEKKDVDEEEERDEEERGINPMLSTLPQSLSQLIKISQKLQIPPEEVLDLLQKEKQKDFFAIPSESRTPARTYTTTHDAHKTFAAAPHRRPLKTLESHNIAQDILSILELASAALQNYKLRQRPMQPKTLQYYKKERDLPEYVLPETSRDDYDDTVGDEDELSNYMASEMFAQAPRNGHLTPSRDEEQSMYGKHERHVQDYFDKSMPEKRPVERVGPATGIDDYTMMKIMRYLDPESDNASETDSEGETVPEM